MVATELLKLALETDEERKARLKKMVATTQLRLAPETEDERRARLVWRSRDPLPSFHWGTGEGKGLVSLACWTCAGATIVVLQSDCRIPLNCIPCSLLSSQI